MNSHPVTPANQSGPQIPQLAKITSLLQKNKQIVSEINHPISFLISMSIFPFLFREMITHPLSPFHEAYMSFCKRIFMDSEEALISLPNYQALNASLERAQAFHDIFIQKIQAIMTQLFDQNPMDLTMEELIHAIEVKFKAMAPQFNRNEELKRDLARVATYLWEAADRFPKEVIAAEYRSFPFKQLSLTNAYRLVEEMGRSVMTYTHHEFLDEANHYVQAVAFRTIRIVLLCPTMILTYFTNAIVIDPLVDWVYPNGVWQDQAPIIPQLLTRQQAGEWTYQLRQYHQQLSETVEVHKRTQRYCASLFLLAAAYLMSYKDNDYREYGFLVGVVASYFLLKHLTRYLMANYYIEATKAKLQHIQACWKEAIPSEYEAKITLHSEGLVEASYITIDFPVGNKKKKNYLNYAQIFNDCCLHHQINLTSQKHHSVCIFASNAMTYHKAKAIEQLFIASIKRYQMIAAYLEQVNQIYAFHATGKHANELTKTYGFDNLGLPHITVQFAIPLHLSEPIQAIKQLFPQTVLISKPEEKVINLILNDVTSCKPQALTDFIQSLTAAVAKAKAQSDSMDAAKPSSSTSVSTAVINQKLNIKPLKEQSPQTNLAKLPASNMADKKETSKWEVPTIQWLSGHSKQRNVFSILLKNQVDSAKNRARARNFITNALSANLIPKNIYTALQNQVTGAKFVPSKGDPGIVGLRKARRMKDQQGKQFTATHKIKLLGDLGDIRAYAASEMSASGETLLVVRAIHYKAHKEEKRMKFK